MNQQEYIIDLSIDREKDVLKYLTSRRIAFTKISINPVYLISVSPIVAQEIRQTPGVIAIIPNSDIATISDNN
jgi:hypothetical protein